MIKTRKKPLTKEQLDELAAIDGFTWERDLEGLPRALYSNGELNRVYHTHSGRIVSQYIPTNRTEFHNPISCPSLSFSSLSFRQYLGKNIIDYRK